MGKLVFFVLAGVGFAQTPFDSTTPTTPQSTDDKHILGLVPNYATVNDPSAPFQAIRTKEKFKLATQDAFDPFSWAIAGIYAGVGQWGNSYPGYGQGAQGYAKRYGAAFADGTIGNYMTEGVFPTVFHQDPRYFRLGTGGGWKRVGYAISRTVVTRSDKGAWQFNASEIVGNAVAAGISSAYYPAGNRTVEDTFDKFALNVASDAGFNVLKEFWPDMRRKILHRE